MRFNLIVLFALTSFLGMAQKSEELVPKHATSVVSLNNISLLQRISLDELVKYEFMEELQQELFDGSTKGKTLNDAGIDFDQKLNVFFGSNESFEISGVTFGVKDKNKLFDVFDDYQPIESVYDGIEFYTSYINTIAIRKNSVILFRVTPNMDLVNDLTDSIWYARGNESPWDYEFEQSIEQLLNEYDDEGAEEAHEIDWDEMEADEEDFFEEMETEENTSNPIDTDELPLADEDPTTKTYYELLDSVQLSLQEEFSAILCDELFTRNENLVNQSAAFASQIGHSTEGMFYLDNSRAFATGQNFSTLRFLHPGFYADLLDLYQGNVVLGDLSLQDNSIQLKLNAQYGERLGSVYSRMTDAKFDKDILKYIHKDHAAYMTFRVDTRAAYDEFFSIFHPILEKEADQDRRFASNLLSLELMNELINKDAVFNTYTGGAFGVYNGISKVKTKKFVFDYDEETFEYTEREIEAEEDMPLFAFGFSTANFNIIEIVLKHFARTEPNCTINNGIWKIDNAILNSAPLYIFHKNGMVIYTNDHDLALNHSDGYGADALSKSNAKSAMKSGFVYGFADLNKAFETLPREIFNDQENEVIDVIRGKSGHLKLTSTATSKNSTSFNFDYSYQGEYDASGTYLLDLINGLYVISK